MLCMIVLCAVYAAAVMIGGQVIDAKAGVPQIVADGDADAKRQAVRCVIFTNILTSYHTETIHKRCRCWCEAN